MFILEADGITKEYHGQRKKAMPLTVLRSVCLSIEQGEFVAVMGPSGSGKTTLLNILCGLDKASEGTIRIAGQDISLMENDELAMFRRKRIGIVFQDYNLLDSLSLKENVMLPLVLDGVQLDQIEEKTKEVLVLLGIESVQDQYPYTVSGGQQQRTSIARAIIAGPDIVFADEPTGNLDSRSSSIVMKHFEDINALYSTTIVMVTHDPFAASWCKRVIWIKDGAICLELKREGNRKEFFEAILESQARIGCDQSDV